MEAAEREIERLTAERDDWRAAHGERFSELQAVCEDRDAQVDEVVRLRDIAWKWGNRAEEAEQQRDALRAENERLKAETERLLMLAAADSQPDYEENQRLNVEVQTLRDLAWKYGNRVDEAEAEIEQLREECRLAAELQIRTGQEADRLRAFIEKVALFCNDPQLSREAWTITPDATLASHKRA